MDPTEPMSLGGELPEGTDLDLVLSSSGTAAFIPRSVKKMSTQQIEICAQLQARVRLVMDAQADMLDLVHAGRRIGMSYATLGWCLGVTEGAVRKMMTADRPDKEPREPGPRHGPVKRPRRK